MTFELPKIGGAQSPSITKNQFCVSCDKNLKSEAEFCQSARICKACLAVYAAIDAHLNQLAEEKVIQVKRSKFLLNFGGQKI